MEGTSQGLVVAGWILIACYAAVIIFFVVRGASKIKSMSDYATGNLAFSPVAVGLSLAASTTSAATFIINPGFVTLYGLSGFLSFGIIYPLAAIVSLVVLTKGFRKYGSVVQAGTMARWMGERYRSAGFKMFFAVLSLLLITFIVLICVGLTKVLARTLDLNELPVLIGIVVFIFGYMMFGGANSMIYTNTIQAVLMLVVAFILLGSGYEHFSAGIKGFLTKLSAVDPALTGAVNAKSPLFRDYFEILICQIIVGVAIICQPHIITKSLILKSDRDVNRYLVTGVLVQIVFFAVVLTGLYARLAFPDLAYAGKPLKMDGIIPAYVVSEFPVWVGLIVILGLISAGISTLEGLIQALGSTITGDILQPLFGKFYPVEPERNAKVQIGLNRLAIAVVAVVSILLSYDQLVNPKLSVAIFAQAGVYAYFAAAFVPVLFGTFFRHVHSASVIAASITAVIVHYYLFYVGRFPGLTRYFYNDAGEALLIRNPGITAAMGIVASVVVGLVLYFALRPRLARNHAPEEALQESA